MSTLQAKRQETELGMTPAHEPERPMIRKATIHRFPYVMFSREDSRFFGNAPIKDIARVRDEGFARRDGDR